MEFGALSESTTQWLYVDLKSSLRKVEDRTVAILKNLADVLSQPAAFTNWEFEVQVDQTTRGSTFISPFGQGRGILGFIVAPGGVGQRTQVIGRYEVHRKIPAPSGGFEWQPVWSLVIPEYGNIFLGDTDQHPLDIDNIFDNGQRAKIYCHIAMNILSAIANGPIEP